MNHNIYIDNEKIIQNKHIYHEYFIEKKMEAGIVLLGWEVKSIRLKKISINNSYISFHNKEAYIYNAILQSNTISLSFNKNYDPIRARKLLLKKNELLFLQEKVNRQQYTIVILNLYWKKSWIKACIALAKGKKKYDKRNIIKKNMWAIEKTNFLKYKKK